jgi:hypothetical protein
MNIAIITTFPTASWEIYSKKAMQSWGQFLPKEIPILAALDDDLVLPQLQKLLRQQDAISVGWSNEHKAFVERNKDKESQTDYRKQPVRFCHKVFAIKRAMDAILDEKKSSGNSARYLIWLDADVVINRPVTMEEIKECIPKEGDAVAYMGRKDWDHSECGWLAFDLEMNGQKLIEAWLSYYLNDSILQMEQWHDSWVFDQVSKLPKTNLTEGKPGMDIWPHSPMGKWSTHFKGPQAKAGLAQGQPRPTGNITIETKNAIPHEQIRDNIRINQMLISKWLKPCHANSEELVVVSGGPMLIAEDVREHVKAGLKVVAVKNALTPLKNAGIKPWMCILLDPREHVAGFVESPDPEVKWLVASQVNPEATKRLLESGCDVTGYHAAVGAGEENLTSKQDYAIIEGGSATATRGLFVLNHLGFKNFHLYGYDLCYPDKQDLDAKDKYGQPKYLEVSIGFTHPYCNMKRNYYTEPQLIAQFEELNEIVRSKRFNIKAYGQGVIPFLVKARETGELREREIKAKLKPQKLSSYKELWNRPKRTPLLTRLRGKLPLSRRKQMKNSNLLTA